MKNRIWTDLYPEQMDDINLISNPVSDLSYVGITNLSVEVIDKEGKGFRITATDFNNGLAITEFNSPAYERNK